MVNGVAFHQRKKSRRTWYAKNFTVIPELFTVNAHSQAAVCDRKSEGIVGDASLEAAGLYNVEWASRRKRSRHSD
jgi:hypothetical protein